MRVRTSGVATKLSKQEARSALKFYFKKLVEKGYIKKERLSEIDVEILFQEKGMGQTKAMAMWLFDNKDPKDFEILVNTKSGRHEQLKALAHEAVHIKQWASKEMFDYSKDDSKVRWRGKVYKNTLVTNDDNYEFDPWEVEAYGLEVGLYRSYMNVQQEKKENDRRKRSKDNSV